MTKPTTAPHGRRHNAFAGMLSAIRGDKHMVDANPLPAAVAG